MVLSRAARRKGTRPGLARSQLVFPSCSASRLATATAAAAAGGTAAVDGPPEPHVTSPPAETMGSGPAVLNRYEVARRHSRDFYSESAGRNDASREDLGVPVPPEPPGSRVSGGGLFLSALLNLETPAFDPSAASIVNSQSPDF